MSDSLTSPSNRSVTVLGAGVAGLSVATELARRGIGVSLVDRAGAPGPGACSWWAGGMLAPFCEGESAEEPVTRLGQEAADWWDAAAGGVTRAGTLVLALGRDRSELDRFARRTERHETLGPEAIAALEPDLAGRFNRALFFADEAHLDPRATLKALRDGLARRGVTVETGDPAANGVAAAGEGVVFDCRGFAARDRLADLRGVKGEMLVLRCPDVSLTRPVRLLHPRIPLYIVPRGDGVYMLGATMIESSDRSRVTARSLLEMLTSAYALHPAFGEAEVLEIGVDARPAFPDNLPRIRRRGARIHVNGLYRHGFLLAPAMARMAADLVTGGPRPEVMDEDRPER
ncbi:glycine oxidase ThiO [Amaricoccus sp. W119]|uniref:glycine oxidase ThiO n=1 Tax=Amaricoccus sp. W119 TaxID=3391833 RepID=UPI0039A506EE